MQLAMINDEILPLDKLDSAYLDRGLYFGDGVYEVIRSYDGRIFALDEHLARFGNSLAGIEINDVNIEQIRKKVIDAFETAKIQDARIYFHITRGSAQREHNWDDHIKPNFFLTITELPDFTGLKEKGIAVLIQPDLRWKKCWIKSLNLLPNILARHAAAAKGCDEAILVDLPSITRSYVIKAAEKLNIEVVEKSLTPEEAKNADELFLTVTTKDIIPVIKFDDETIGNSQPGAITKNLISEFLKFTK
jgi:D-alanine transaminase